MVPGFPWDPRILGHPERKVENVTHPKTQRCHYLIVDNYPSLTQHLRFLTHLWPWKSFPRGSGVSLCAHRSWRTLEQTHNFWLQSDFFCEGLGKQKRWTKAETTRTWGKKNVDIITSPTFEDKTLFWGYSSQNITSETRWRENFNGIYSATVHLN